MEQARAIPATRQREALALERSHHDQALNRLLGEKNRIAGWITDWVANMSNTVHRSLRDGVFRRAVPRKGIMFKRIL
jgi:hypothetical protein